MICKFILILFRQIMTMFQSVASLKAQYRNVQYFLLSCRTLHTVNLNKSTKPASNQSGATIGPSAKRHLNGVSLGADSGPIVIAYWEA